VADDQQDRPRAGQTPRRRPVRPGPAGAVLAAFARTGQPPARSELERLARSHGADPDTVLAELAEADGNLIRFGSPIPR